MENPCQDQNLEYFNMQLLGLSGIPNPAVRNITDFRDAYKLRVQIKFLFGDMRNSPENVEETLNVVSVVYEIRLFLTYLQSVPKKLKRITAFYQQYSASASIQPNSGLLGID